MASWILTCKSCGNVWTHSPIADATLSDFLLPSKPKFSPAGEDHECSSCKEKSTYQRSDLTYQRNPKPKA